jgi:FMN-dependent NADH-azoreductase
MKLLHIIASQIGEQSRTLSISDEFLKNLVLKTPELIIDDLNLFKTILPEISGDTIDA